MNKENQVYTTTNYSLFKSIQGNRTINNLHLERLKKSMQKKYLFTIITINEKYQIIDGQHRFECIKELGFPLNYVVCVGYGLDEVQLLNENSKTWTAEDYLSGYCNLGNEDYLEFKKFKEKYNFGYNECIAMLSGANVSGGTDYRFFKTGLFKIKDLKNAEIQAVKIHSLKQYYNGYKRRSFVYAMLYLFDHKNFDFDDFVNNLKKQPSSLTDCNDSKQYIAVIETIYNYRRQNKVNLRF